MVNEKIKVIVNDIENEKNQERMLLKAELMVVQEKNDEYYEKMEGLRDRVKGEGVMRVERM